MATAVTEDNFQSWGGESIEIVDSNEVSEMLRAAAMDGGREDIAKAKSLPTQTKGGLYYSNQDGLNIGKNKVKARPRIDEKIQESMATLSDILQTPQYEPLNNVCKDNRDLLSGAIQHAKQQSTSLSAAHEALNIAVAVFRKACESVADKFELPNESTEALAEYKMCERERIECLKNASMEEAEQKRAEGVQLLEKAITTGKRDVQSILERHRMEEEAQTLEEFEKQKQTLEDLVNSEISELVIMSDNCENDIQKTKQSMECLTHSGEAAFRKYSGEDQELCQKLQENQAEQEELQRRLEQLQKQENDLKEEREAKKKLQERAEEIEKRAAEELGSWKDQIAELHEMCKAALIVMWQFEEGSRKLINSSIESKTGELKRLHELDIQSQRSLRNALAAAAVNSKQHIENCNHNLDYLKTEIEGKKKEQKEKSRTGLAVIVQEIKKSLETLKASRNKFHMEKAESEQKLEEYNKQMAEADVRLQALGEAVESFNDIYERYKQEEQALWDSEASLGSLED